MSTVLVTVVAGVVAGCQTLPPAGRVGAEAPWEAFIRSSRLFAGPELYPPGDFAAYGIVAFKSRATPDDRDRHLMICEAYLAALPHVGELPVPIPAQMATVWPLTVDALARRLNTASLAMLYDPTSLERSELRFLVSDEALLDEPATALCDIALQTYGLVMAERALRDARAAGVDTAGEGPFLLAWSPAEEKGRPDALVLRVDLSNVTTYAQARSVFADWRSRIEADPTLWRDGWSVERVRREIRLWFDKYGVMLMELFEA